VNVLLKLDRVEQAARADEREVRGHADDDDRGRGDRTRDRDREVLTRGRGLALHQREPAEQVQIDPFHADTPAARGDRVAELVQDDRREQRKHADDRGQVRDRVGAVEGRAKRPRQQVDHQEQDDEPAHVDTDADAGHREQPHRTGAPEHAAMVA
jgi:hypothetical protein